MTEQQNMLMGFAQIAAGLMGFLAILVIFVREDGRLAPVDALRSRSILYNAQAVLIGGLLPIILYEAGLEGQVLWQASAGLTLAMSAVPFAEGMRFNLAMPMEDRRQVGLPTAILSWGGSTVASLLMLSVVIGVQESGAYFLAAGVCVAVASYNFVAVAVQRWL